jgi:hypothetical protein
MAERRIMTITFLLRDGSSVFERVFGTKRWAGDWFSKNALGVWTAMKTFVGCAALALALVFTTISADAKGCIKGAIVGGVAGHVAGRHGVLGAAAGCVIGHHEANKKSDNSQTDTSPQP